MSTECGGKLMREPRSLCSTPGVEPATCFRSMKHPRKQNQLPRGTATMLNSVRIRLTLWYTAAMTLVLVVLAAATYFVLRQNVVRRADANATELADSFLSTVSAELGDASRPDSVDEGIAAAISDRRFAAASCNGAGYVQVRARRGAPVPELRAAFFGRPAGGHAVRSAIAAPAKRISRNAGRNILDRYSPGDSFRRCGRVSSGAAKSLASGGDGRTGEPHRFGESLRTPPSAESAGRTW